MSVLALVDWQNLFRACENRFSIDTVLGEILSMAFQRNDSVEEVRLFVPNYQLITSPWRFINALQLKYGLKVEVCPALREGAEMEESYKDMVDFEVLGWTMKHVHPGIGPDLILFVSGDGHFILAGNEAKMRRKEVEFWVVDPNMTSGAILRNMTVRQIEISGQGILETEENPFISSLNKATTEQKLTEEDKERLGILRRMGEISTGMEKPVTIEAKMGEISQQFQKKLNVSERDVLKALKTLMVLRVARIYPVSSQGFSIDSSSLLLQWLKTTG